MVVQTTHQILDDAIYCAAFMWFYARYVDCDNVHLTLSLEVLLLYIEIYTATVHF